MNRGCVWHRNSHSLHQTPKIFFYWDERSLSLSAAAPSWPCVLIHIRVFLIHIRVFFFSSLSICHSISSFVSRQLYRSVLLLHPSLVYYCVAQRHEIKNDSCFHSIFLPLSASLSITPSVCVISWKAEIPPYLHLYDQIFSSLCKCALSCQQRSQAHTLQEENWGSELQWQNLVTHDDDDDDDV